MVIKKTTQGEGIFQYATFQRWVFTKSSTQQHCLFLNIVFPVRNITYIQQNNECYYHELKQNLISGYWQQKDNFFETSRTSKDVGTTCENNKDGCYGYPLLSVSANYRLLASSTMCQFEVIITILEV